METSGIRVLEAAAGVYLPLRNNGEDINAGAGSYDDARLNQLGYKQELSRSLSCVRFLDFFTCFCFLCFLIVFSCDSAMQTKLNFLVTSPCFWKMGKNI